MRKLTEIQVFLADLGINTIWNNDRQSSTSLPLWQNLLIS